MQPHLESASPPPSTAPRAGPEPAPTGTAEPAAAAESDAGRAARCARCWDAFEPRSWIERSCPRCAAEAWRAGPGLPLVAAGVLALPVFFGLSAALAERSRLEVARSVLYVLLMLGGILFAAGRLWAHRARQERRRAALAAGYRPPASSRSPALGPLALCWAIAGVSLIAFPLGAELTRHAAGGARDPLLLAWLTFSEPWQFAGAAVWRATFTAYLGLTLLGAALRLRSHRHGGAAGTAPRSRAL